MPSDATLLCLIRWKNRKQFVSLLSFCSLWGELVNSCLHVCTHMNAQCTHILSPYRFVHQQLCSFMVISFSVTSQHKIKASQKMSFLQTLNFKCNWTITFRLKSYFETMLDRQENITFNHQLHPFIRQTHRKNYHPTLQFTPSSKVLYSIFQLFWFSSLQLYCLVSLSPLSLASFFSYNKQLFSAKNTHCTQPARH